MLFASLLKGQKKKKKKTVHKTIYTSDAKRFRMSMTHYHIHVSKSMFMQKRSKGHEPAGEMADINTLK